MNRDVKIGLAIGLLLLVGLFVWFAWRASSSKPDVAGIPENEANETLGADRTSSPGPTDAPSAKDYFATDCTTLATPGDTATVQMGAQPGSTTGKTDLTANAQKFAELLKPKDATTPPDVFAGSATSAPSTGFTSAPSTYVVKKGDYLSTISRKVYGTARHWEKIAQANNITDARNLRAGMTLKIPALSDAERGTTAVKSGPAAASFTAPTGSEQIHKVVNGETLSDISKKYYGSTKFVKQIMEANKLTDARLLRVGSTLVIPRLASSAPAPVAAPVVPAAGPAAVPVAFAPVGGNREYVVREGDTLQMISRKFYGSTKHYLVIMQANNLDDPRSVRIGAKLIIPAKPEFGAAAAPAPAVPATATIANDPSVAPGERLYTVREGDTFAIVAATELGSSLYSEDVMKRNHLTAADSLRPGQVLVLPARSALSTLTSVTRDE